MSAINADTSPARLRIAKALLAGAASVAMIPFAAHAQSLKSVGRRRNERPAAAAGA